MSLPRGAHGTVFAVALALLVGLPGRSSTPLAQAAEDPCAIRTSDRVVAIGDVHGAYEPFLTILRSAGLIDVRDRWIGGRARLVQTGDVLDRGPDSRKVIDLLRRLEHEAANAGGRVHALLGNHELMRLAGDWRYVSVGELRAFTDEESVDRRERVHARLAEQAAARAKAEKRPFSARAYRVQFMREVPLGFIEMGTAFESDGDYGHWIRSRAGAVKINEVLFVHGGVSEKVSTLGCEGLNKALHADLAALSASPENLVLASTEDGPLWYRGLAAEPEESFGATVETILRRLGARAIVVGHTPAADARIRTRFAGRVILIDTGMLNGEFYPGGVPSALELLGDTFTAIYADRREPIAAPAPGTR